MAISITKLNHARTLLFTFEGRITEHEIARALDLGFQHADPAHGPLYCIRDLRQVEQPLSTLARLWAAARDIAVTGDLGHWVVDLGVVDPAEANPDLDTVSRDLAMSLFTDLTTALHFVRAWGAAAD